MDNIFIIGITGASGSGKSYLAQQLIQELKIAKPTLSANIIMQDAYYRDQSHLSFIERTKTNYDHPDALEYELLINHLLKLKQGHNITIPIYDYAQHTRCVDQVMQFKACQLIILDGLLILAEPTIRELLDCIVYIDTPLDICFIRRLLRDMQSRGRSLESIIEQYNNSVRPMYFEFIAPYKQYADLIINDYNNTILATSLIQEKIDKLLSN